MKRRIFAVAWLHCFERMKEYKENRIAFAWLLLFVLSFPVIAKDIHVYWHEHGANLCDHSEGHASEHDCNSCPVCQFTYYTFTDAGVLQIDTVVAGYGRDISSFYPEEVHDAYRLFTFLRAPPFIDLVRGAVRLRESWVVRYRSCQRNKPKPLAKRKNMLWNRALKWF